MSEYRLQIVFADGSVARFHPGAKSEEGQLVSACVERIAAKGVGLWHTEAAVRAAIADGLREVFMELKAGVQG